ncbi:MAG: hypothetical protein R3B93_04075 [Bacteroidia bacterium]
MKHYILLLVLIIFSGAKVFSQHLINESEILKRNRIKSLTISNCFGSGCIKNDYFFDENGQKIKFIPAVVNMYFEWEYDDKGRLKVEWVKNHCCNEDTLQYSIHSFYDKKNEMQISSRIRSTYENGKVIEEEKISAEKKRKEYPGKTNHKGQIIEQEVGPLSYPCGVYFEGNNRIQYYYAPSGLISGGEIYNESNEIIIELEYAYQRY